MESSTKAREAAASLLAGQAREDAEAVLALNVSSEVLDEVATAKALLEADFGSTPAGFIEGVDRANAIMKDPFPEPGNIYAPPAPTERVCPWCAETIKAVAVICRYCDRGVQAQPDSPAPS